MKRIKYCFSAVIILKIVFVNVFAGTVHCNFSPALHCNNHKNIYWEKPGFTSATTLAKSDDLLFISQNDQTYGIKLDTGENVWQHQAPNNARYFHPAVKDNYLYLASTDGRLEKLHATTGQTIWSKIISKGWIYPPAFVKNMLYTGGQDHILLAVNPKNGEIIHQRNLHQEMVTAPLATENAVVISTFDGRLEAFTPSQTSSKINSLWQIQLPAPAFKIDQYQFSILASTMDGSIQAISLDKGKMIWQHTPNQSAQFWSLTHNDQIFSISNQGEFSVISLINGQLIEQRNLPQSYAQAPIIQNDKVALIDTQGNILTINVDSFDLALRAITIN